MKFELYVLACLGLFVSLEAKKLPMLPPSHPYIMSIELIFNEDNIVDFITESFFATIDEDLDVNKNSNITLYDVLSVLPVDDLTLAFNELNITLQDGDVTQLIQGLNYSELVDMGFSAKKVYRNVVNAYFQNATQNLLNCLNILDVTVEFTTAYAFGTDEEFFQAFQKGNFSVYNLQEISALVNTPPNGISKILGIKHYDTPYVRGLVNKELTELLMVRGLQRENLRKFLDVLELEVGDFKKIKSFKNFYKLHTEGESLGVAVSPNEVITNDDAIIQSLLNLDKYANLKVRSLQNSKVKYLIGADDVRREKEGIFTIHIEEDMPSYISKTNNYQGILLKNCTYVTEDVKHKLTARNVSVNMIETKLTISKFLGITYKRGSPLVCESLLYGLAELNNVDSITFTMVAEQVNVAKIDSDALNGLLDLLSSFIQLFDVCSFTNCKVLAADSNVGDGVNQGENQLKNQSETQKETHTEAAVQTQSQSEFEEESQSGDESETVAQNQTENEAGRQTTVQSQNHSELDNEEEVQTQTEAEVQLQFELEVQNQFQDEAQSETAVQTQSQSEFEGQSQSDTEEKWQTGTEAQTHAQSEFEEHFQTEDQTQSETETQTEVVIDDRSQSEVEVEDQFESENGIQAESEMQIDSADVQTENADAAI